MQDRQQKPSWGGGLRERERASWASTSPALNFWLIKFIYSFSSKLRGPSLSSKFRDFKVWLKSFAKPMLYHFPMQVVYFFGFSLKKNSLVFNIQSSLSYFCSQYWDWLMETVVFSLHLFYFSFIFNAYGFIEFLFFFSLSAFPGLEWVSEVILSLSFDNLFCRTQPSLLTWYSCFRHTHYSLYNGSFPVLSLRCHLGLGLGL